MSNNCGNCDCADKTNCVKKGNSYGIDMIVETEKMSVDTMMMMEGSENDGKCKCGTNCTCTNCGCGAH